MPYLEFNDPQKKHHSITIYSKLNQHNQLNVKDIISNSFSHTNNAEHSSAQNY